MHRFLVILTFLATGMLFSFMTGCKDNSTNPSYSPPASQPMFSVAMAGNTFSPGAETVALHTTITWYNNSSVTHTATDDAGKWDTGDIPAGGSKTITFDTAGTFHYHCRYHSGMTGTITVQ